MFAYEICRRDSGLGGKAKDTEREGTYAKQRSVCNGHHKCYGLGVLSASYPNGMSTTVELDSSRENDLNIPRLSKSYDILHELHFAEIKDFQGRR